MTNPSDPLFRFPARDLDTARARVRDWIERTKT